MEAFRHMNGREVAVYNCVGNCNVHEKGPSKKNQFKISFNPWTLK